MCYNQLYDMWWQNGKPKDYYVALCYTHVSNYRLCICNIKRIATPHDTPIAYIYSEFEWFDYTELNNKHTQYMDYTIHLYLHVLVPTRVQTNYLLQKLIYAIVIFVPQFNTVELGEIRHGKK